MNEVQRKFELLSPRKQLRELASLVDGLQRLFAASESGEIQPAQPLLDAIQQRLGWMSVAGLFPGRLPRWNAAFGSIVRMLAAKTSAKAVLAATNNLWHEMAERAEIPSGEENYLVRTSDRQTPAGSSFPCEVVLDNIRSAFNTGSIIRSAEGFGVQELFLVGITAGQDNPKVQKTAMGATNSLSIKHQPSLHALIREKKRTGFTVYAVETVSGAGNLMCEQFRFPLCLIMGNEEYGIPEDYLAAADRIIHIPMFGRKNSFNVAVSCSIVLYAARQQWEQSQTRTAQD